MRHATFIESVLRRFSLRVSFEVLCQTFSCSECISMSPRVFRSCADEKLVFVTEAPDAA